MSVQADEAPNYWDLIAENSRLTERLLAILEQPMSEAPIPRLTRGTTYLQNIQCERSTAYGVTVRLTVTNGGDAIQYLVTGYDGRPFFRGQWTFEVAE